MTKLPSSEVRSYLFLAGQALLTALFIASTTALITVAARPLAFPQKFYISDRGPGLAVIYRGRVQTYIWDTVGGEIQPIPSSHLLYTLNYDKFPPEAFPKVTRGFYPKKGECLVHRMLFDKLFNGHLPTQKEFEVSIGGVRKRVNCTVVGVYRNWVVAGPIPELIGDVETFGKGEIAGYLTTSGDPLNRLTAVGYSFWTPFLITTALLSLFSFIVLRLHRLADLSVYLMAAILSIPLYELLLKAFTSYDLFWLPGFAASLLILCLKGLLSSPKATRATELAVE